jgi:hypothetical protein
MKPDEARRRRMRAEQDAAAHSERLEHFLRTGAPRDQVRPELIPTPEDHREAVRQVRALVKRAERTAKGPRRAKVLDQLMVAMARLVFVERVMEIEDPVARAALTPARLVGLSVIDPDDLTALWLRMKGEGAVLLDKETGR